MNECATRTLCITCRLLNVITRIEFRNERRRKEGNLQSRRRNNLRAMWRICESYMYTCIHAWVYKRLTFSHSLTYGRLWSHARPVRLSLVGCTNTYKESFRVILWNHFIQWDQIENLLRKWKGENESACPLMEWSDSCIFYACHKYSCVPDFVSRIIESLLPLWTCYFVSCQSAAHFMFLFSAVRLKNH